MDSASSRTVAKVDMGAVLSLLPDRHHQADAAVENILSEIRGHFRKLGAQKQMYTQGLAMVAVAQSGAVAQTRLWLLRSRHSTAGSRNRTASGEG